MLHVITGPPCAGKSTYVAQAMGDADVRIDFDVLAHALGAREDHAAGEFQRAATFRARAAAIDYLIEQSQNSAFDGWVIHSEPRPEQMAAYDAAGADVMEIDPGIEECTRRAVADGRPPETFEEIRAWYDRHEKKGHNMNVQHKSAGGAKMEAAGTVHGYAATFDREPDSYGDVIRAGAFDATVKEWAEKRKAGIYLPLLYGHNTEDPEYNIGRVIDMGQDERGLWVRAEFDADNQKAQYVRKLATEGRLYQFSFAYSVNDAAPVELENGTKANELRDLTIYEVSLVQIPANQHAEIVDVKHATYTVDVVPTVKSEGIEDLAEQFQAIIERLDEIITAITPPEGDAAPEDTDETEGGDGASAADREETAELLEFIENIENENNEMEG